MKDQQGEVSRLHQKVDDFIVRVSSQPATELVASSEPSSSLPPPEANVHTSIVPASNASGPHQSSSSPPPRTKSPPDQSPSFTIPLPPDLASLEDDSDSDIQEAIRVYRIASSQKKQRRALDNSKQAEEPTRRGDKRTLYQDADNEDVDRKAAKVRYSFFVYTGSPIFSAALRETTTQPLNCPGRSALVCGSCICRTTPSCRTPPSFRQ